MSIENTDSAQGTKQCPVSIERHTVEFRDGFDDTTKRLHEKCPMAWSDSYGGYWGR